MAGQFQASVAWLSGRVKRDPFETDYSGLELPTDEMPYGWRHPVTGRRQLEPDPLMVRVGAHHRRARYFAGKSQDRLGVEARVTQSQISRFERALAPSMDVDKLARLAEALHPHFPLGYCPHVHYCPWQPMSALLRPVSVGPPRGLDFASLSAALDRAAAEAAGDDMRPELVGGPGD